MAVYRNDLDILSSGGVRMALASIALSNDQTIHMDYAS